MDPARRLRPRRPARSRRQLRPGKVDRHFPADKSERPGAGTTTAPTRLAVWTPFGCLRAQRSPGEGASRLGRTAKGFTRLVTVPPRTRTPGLIVARERSVRRQRLLRGQRTGGRRPASRRDPDGHDLPGREPARLGLTSRRSRTRSRVTTSLARRSTSATRCTTQAGARPRRP